MSHDEVNEIKLRSSVGVRLFRKMNSHVQYCDVIVQTVEHKSLDGYFITSA